MQNEEFKTGGVGVEIELLITEANELKRIVVNPKRNRAGAAAMRPWTS